MKEKPSQIFYLIFDLDEEFLIESLEKEIHVSPTNLNFLKRLFVERPECYDYDQVALEYEKPQWKRREECYYKVIDIIIKKISGGEAKRGIAEFLNLFKNYHYKSSVLDGTVMFMKLLRDVDLLKNGNKLDLRNLTRDDFIPFRPAKEDFINVRTIDFEELSTITKTGRIELKTPYDQTISKASPFGYGKHLNHWRVNDSDSISIFYDKSVTYEELKGIAEASNRRLPADLSQEESYGVTENLTLRHSRDKAGTLDLLINHDLNGSKISTGNLRTGLTFLTPNLNPNQHRKFREGERYERGPLYSYPHKALFEPNSIIKGAKGIPETHKIFTEKLKMRRAGSENAPNNRSSLGYQSIDTYYGVYNKRFKKVILRPDILRKGEYAGQKRFDFENDNNGEAIVRLSEVGTYDEILRTS